MAIVDPDVEQLKRDIQRDYTDFLDDAANTNLYAAKIAELVDKNGIRLIVNINDVRQKFPKRAAELLKNGFQELVCFQLALKEAVARADPEYAKQHEEFFIGFEGSNPPERISAVRRVISPEYLAVAVDNVKEVAQATKTPWKQLLRIKPLTTCECSSSVVRPKVVRSVHYCPATKKNVERRYADLTSYEGIPTSSVFPTKDEDGHLYETEFGLSVYKDHQTLSIQEMPESAPAGQLPRSVDIVVDNDLVDGCKPGDRIRVVGMYRCLPNKQQGFTPGTFRTILLANNIQLLNKEAAPVFSSQDIKTIRRFGKTTPDVFHVIARSLAPSIHGNEEVKEAILCLLLGGTERTLANGTRLRGDINVLLVGDPSVAKSQLLRYVLHTAPRAIATTGRGSSGVGLTAAVTTDPETGDRRLEAGAMVLADRGIVCIDEFDKMTDVDRTAIHEVMEQGRVTIAKAGIHARLNARCAVLAAANPVYGRYDQHKNPMENIGLQDSLLSRFDLLFILLDTHDKESDRKIADHVVEMHRYRSAGEEDGAVLPMGAAIETLTTELENEEEEEAALEVYEKSSDWLPMASKHDANMLGTRFMRKYIHVAKMMQPELTIDAAKLIGEKYAELRSSEQQIQEDSERTAPVTARTLETLIRVSTAFAKARLAETVTKKDAQQAFDLLHFAYFKKKARETPDGEENEDPTATRKRKAASNETDADEVSDTASENHITPRKSRRLRGAAEQTAVVISPERYTAFKRFLRKLYDDNNATEVLLLQFIMAEAVKSRFEDEEIEAAITKLCDENKAMKTATELILI